MMKTALSATGRYLKQTDWLLMLCCVGLSSFSTLLIYSLYVNGEVGRLNTVLVQPAMAICGVAAAIVLSKIDYHLMARLWKWHTALCYGLLLLLFPFGVQRVEWVDDRNWLPIPFLGINFQPSELLKISFIITFAYHLSRVKENLNRPKQLLGLLLHGGHPLRHHPPAGRRWHGAGHGDHLCQHAVCGGAFLEVHPVGSGADSAGGDCGVEFLLGRR